MKIIGLTGSIGMGKSVATAMLRDMGVPVHCSDEAVHTLLGLHGGGVEVVATAFPGTLNVDEHSINRQALGALIFGNDEKRRKLESILHPLVINSQKRFLADLAQKEVALAVLDIPLLYETGAEKRVDRVIVVSAPAHIQKQRVMARPGMTEEKFAAILAAQMPDADKRKRADFIVETGNGMEETRQELARIITLLKE